MNVNNLCTVMNQNNIDYDSKFQVVESAGFPTNECQELSANIIKTLEEILKHGVNNGFNRSMKITIDGLTKLVVKLTDRRAGDKIQAHRSSFAIYSKDMTLSKKVQFPAGTPFEILTNTIDTCIQLCQSVIPLAKSNQNLYQSSLQLLEQMKETLKELWDVTSIEAANMIIRIINDCVRWTNGVSNIAIVTKDVTYLQSALDNMNILKTKCVHGKRADENAVKPFQSANLAGIIGRVEAQESFDELRKKLNELNDSISELRNSSNELLEVEKEIKNVEDEKMLYIKKQMNGEIDEKELLARIVDLNISFEQLTIKRDHLREMNMMVSDLCRVRQELVNNISRLIYAIDIRVKLYNHPSVLSLFVKYINVRDIIQLLNGIAGQEGASAALDSIENALEIANSIDERNAMTVEQLEKTLAIASKKKYRNAQNPSAPNVDPKEQKAKEEIERLRRSISQTPTQQTDTIADVVEPLEDTDK